MLTWHINDKMKGYYQKWVKNLLDLYIKYENFSMDFISEFVHLSMIISLYITNTLEESSGYGVQMTYNKPVCLLYI